MIFVDGIQGSNSYTQILSQLNELSQVQTQGTDEVRSAEEFSGFFNDAINTLEQSQIDSHNAVQSLVDGTADDLHSVMIQTTEAQLSLEVAVQLRNRALEAYNEISNIQF